MLLLRARYSPPYRCRGFGISELEVTGNQRSAAKAINFGLIYGMSAFGLAKQIGCSRSEAQDYVNLYFERYPGVQKYMDDTRTQAKEQGFVETVLVVVCICLRLTAKRTASPTCRAHRHQRSYAGYGGGYY